MEVLGQIISNASSVILNNSQAWFPHSTWLFSRNLVPITVSFYYFTCAIETNTQDFKVPINSFSVRYRSTLTTLIYSKQNVGEYGITGECINLSLLNRQLNRVMTRLLAAEGMSHNDFQKRTFLHLTWISSMSKEHPAVFYVTPHRVSNESIIFSPKLKHLFFTLLHYF